MTAGRNASADRPGQQLAARSPMSAADCMALLLIGDAFENDVR
jgi:hypothetical protein